MIKAIIFDFFGVLFTDNFDKVYRNFGGNPEKDSTLIKEAYYLSHVGKIGRSSEVFSKHLGVSKKEWEEAIDSDRLLDEELFDYIKTLRNKYKVAVLSNIGARGLSAYVDYGMLSDNFDVVVESSKVGFAKPEARAYEITAERLGVRLDECIFTDDREEYIEGAQHVGMKTILFKNTEQFKQELGKLIS